MTSQIILSNLEFKKVLVESILRTRVTAERVSLNSMKTPVEKAQSRIKKIKVFMGFFKLSLGIQTLPLDKK